MTTHSGSFDDEQLGSGLGTGLADGTQADADEPQPGSRVSLIPTTSPVPRSAPGWRAGSLRPAGWPSAPRSGWTRRRSTCWPVRRSGRTSAPAPAVSSCDGAVAPAAGEDDLLELTGVAMLARETRREAVRAGLRREVRLIAGEVEHPATTLDLSSGGCRVQVAEPEAFDVGEVVDVQLELAGEGPVAAAARSCAATGWPTRSRCGSSTSPSRPRRPSTRWSTARSAKVAEQPVPGPGPLSRDGRRRHRRRQGRERHGPHGHPHELGGELGPVPPARRAHPTASGAAGGATRPVVRGAGRCEKRTRAGAGTRTGRRPTACRACRCGRTVRVGLGGGACGTHGNSSVVGTREECERAL